MLDFIIEETEFNGQPEEAARTLLRDKAGELMTQALRWHDARRTGMTGTTLGEILTPRNAIKITTGIGKSEQLDRQSRLRPRGQAPRTCRTAC